MPAAVEAHVPAWKKLGLKLKNASDPGPATPVLALVPQNKRKFQTTGDENVSKSESKPTKRARRTKSPDGNSINSKPAQDVAHPASITTKKSTLRKSVSFAAGAKIEDGESAKDLYNTWFDSQKSSDPSFDPSAYNQDALKAITPTSIDFADQDPTTLTNTSSKDLQPNSTLKGKKKKKKKKRNKSKSTTIPKAPPISSQSTTIRTTKASESDQPNTTHPALTYLKNHQSSLSTWKFSKSRSSYLLRHLFSLTHIPPSYTPALESYLSGLESQTAIQAIRQRALDIIKEDDEWLNDSSNFEGWNLHLELSNEIEEGQKGGKTEEVYRMDDPIKRKEIYLQALKRHKEIIRAREDSKEEAKNDKAWHKKVARRKRVEGVLHVLNQQVYGNPNGPYLNKSSVIRAPTGRDGVNGNGVTSGTTGNRTPQKAKRKRKRRTTGVPDDDSSSSSSSSSESEPHDDGERIAKRARRIEVLDKEIKVLKGEDSNDESDSDDASSSGSSGSSSDSSSEGEN
ncbi:MAG: hypothetical protein LQ337_000738 [Flavoplaca oasis]|nr:MAG: hypothetical protein LQ337_000738 [Flavoplaca oasis]